ncbi:MAG: hypothetical protein ACLQU1_03205 [Bryobacteraceae bacterium]
MHLHRERPISIWFFIGALLIVYGFLIMGQGMWDLFAPPAHPTVLAKLRSALWWGALLLVVGGAMAGRSAPW